MANAPTFLISPSRIAILNAIQTAPCSCRGESGAPGRQYLSALAAEARALLSFRHRVALTVVGQGAGARLPRGTQGRGVAQDLVSRGVRRGAAHRPGAPRARPQRR